MDEPVSLPHRHTTPTHLFLPDKLLFGLTARQLLFLLVGGSASYGLWLQLDVIPASWGSPGLGLRLLIALPPALCCLLLAFVTVAGRPLELWEHGLAPVRQSAQNGGVATRLPSDPHYVCHAFCQCPSSTAYQAAFARYG